MRASAVSTARLDWGHLAKNISYSKRIKMLLQTSYFDCRMAGHCIMAVHDAGVAKGPGLAIEGKMQMIQVS